MNRLFKLSIVLVLSAAMLLSSFSAFAATDDELTLDIRLMQEFYSQPYHNGDISNGPRYCPHSISIRQNMIPTASNSSC